MKVYKYGANVDTDVIIPARHLNDPSPAALASHCMEDIDPDFASTVETGDIVVAGPNFGCGSSREHAPLALKSCGVKCVIAPSFARIFYRNAINIGFPIVECAQAAEEIGRVPAFDSGTSRFLLVDGALVERTGREAVRQWFDLMLRQQPDRVPIYRTEAGAAGIGVDRQMIGSKLPSGLIAAEIERNVRETASYCPAVRAVRDFEVTRQGRRCHVAFTAVLYDAETVEVSADV